jgi:hypothetical protein
MNYKRTAFLAGIAALALVAGNGLASAQDNTKSEPGQSPNATQHMNGGGMSGQPSQGAQTGERGSMSKQGQRAEDGGNASKDEKATSGQNRAQKQEHNRSAQSNEKKAGQQHNKSATENEPRNRGNTAQERERTGGKNAAERNRTGNTAAEQQNRSGENQNAERGRTGTEGLQGNASGANVKLSERQRSEIRTTVIDARGAPRISHVDFDVAVGTAIPRGKIHVVPVPETLVRIEPDWRGFLYFVYEDEVVIVNPNDMKIVAIVPA